MNRRLWSWVSGFEANFGKPFKLAVFAIDPGFREASACYPAVRGKNGVKMRTGAARTNGEKMVNGERMTVPKTIRPTQNQ